MRYLATTSTAVATFLFLAVAARADITICNEFRAPIHVAFAFEEQGNFTAAGWWNVEPNACQPANFPFQSAVLYYTAHSDSYRDGRATSRDHWGNKMKLYVTSKKFNFDGAERSRSGATPDMFSLYDVPQGYHGSGTITFHFVPGSTTINAKMGQ
jgi:uncharacterized membrane protein